MKQKLFAFILAFFLLLSSALFAQKADGVIRQNEYASSLSLADGDYQLFYTVADDTIHIGIKGKAAGWVSIGFEPSQMMKDADIIIGWVDDKTGKAEVMDTYSTGVVGPHPSDADLGGKDDLLSRAASQEGGWTTVEFSRKLDTGDKFDKVIKKGQMKIIWGLSSKDGLNPMHSKAGTHMVFF